MTEDRWCGGCAAEVAFERFDCAEHPEDCRELICTGCGAGDELIGASLSPSAPALEREAAA